MNPELKDVAEDTCEHPPCTCPPIDGGKLCCEQCENAATSVHPPANVVTVTAPRPAASNTAPHPPRLVTTRRLPLRVWPDWQFIKLENCQSGQWLPF